MSKSLKICTYVLTKGSKSGKKCGARCKKGNRCKYHNNNRKNYVKNYNVEYQDKQRVKVINEKIKSLKDEDGSLPNIDVEIKKMNEILLKLMNQKYKLFACKLALDPSLEI